MKWLAFGSMALLTAMTRPARAADEAFWKSPVGTEIVRGERAADCPNALFGPADYAACILAIQRKNSAKGGDTSAFDAGLYFDTWLVMDSLLEPTTEDIVKTAQPAARQQATRFFRLYRDTQRKLGVPDDRFITATLANDPRPIKSKVAAADNAK